MKPVLKTTLWTVTLLAVIGGAAAPKVMPLIHKEASAKADAGAKAGAAKPGGGSEKQEKGGKGGGKSGAPVRVSTFTVEAANFAETVTSTGTLRADEAVELQAEINGKVTAINFREGTQVQKGHLLVKLNDADLRAQLERAVHRRELATLREKRIAQLLKQGVARQEEYDIALSELDIQRAEVELIDAQIEKTEVRAPFDGVVGLRYVSEGAFVNAATRVATLQRLDKLKIDFSVPEKYAARLRNGAPITFTISGGDRKYSGEIYASDPRIDSTTRTVLIRAVAPNPSGRLLPGAFAHVELTLDQLKDAMLIPALAVVPGLAEKNVFVVENGKAERRAVETGTRLESTVHILSGLQPGDVVITSGLQQIRPGQAVIVAGQKT
ncbi:MAG: efflux RND transporter periplasmic adaptor subunit [Steroidobacteraceae bacterium]